MKAIAYYRVSTNEQGRSGLGLDSQKRSVKSLAMNRGFDIISEFVEIESGSLNCREQLTKALKYARATGSTLIIAKLDRLSRNAAFLLSLRDSTINFVAADMPDATEVTIGLMAVIAQAEREAISKRTQEALDSIKCKLSEDGTYTSPRSGRKIKRLGNPNGWAGRQFETGKAVAALREKSKKRALELAEIIAGIQDSGITSYNGIATELNKTGFVTARDKKWHPSTVRNLIKTISSQVN